MYTFSQLVDAISKFVVSGPQGPQLQKVLERLTGQHTVPNVFIGTKCRILELLTFISFWNMTVGSWSLSISFGGASWVYNSKRNKLIICFNNEHKLLYV